MIKISVPNDDSVALFHFGKSLVEMSSTIEGSPGWVVITRDEYDELKGAQNLTLENEYQITINTDQPELSAARLRECANHLTPQAEPDTTDSTDTPWDERIHSASKALNADGTWRLRRKPKDMDEAEWSDYVSMIKADLEYPVECGGQEPDDKQKLIDETVAKLDALYEPEPPVTPPGDDFHVDVGVVTEQQVADIPPPPPVPVPVPPVKVYGGDMTFPQLMAYLTERHGRISNAQVEQIIAEMGLKSIMELNTQPEHTGPFIARVKALLGE